MYKQTCFFDIDIDMTEISEQELLQMRIKVCLFENRIEANDDDDYYYITS